MAEKADKAVAPGAGHKGLQELFSYPLMSAIQCQEAAGLAREQRTRSTEPISVAWLEVGMSTPGTPKTLPR